MGEGLLRRRLTDIVRRAAVAAQRLAEQHGARTFEEFDMIDGGEIDVLGGEAVRGAVEERRKAAHDEAWRKSGVGRRGVDIDAALVAPELRIETFWPILLASRR